MLVFPLIVLLLCGSGWSQTTFSNSTFVTYQGQATNTIAIVICKGIGGQPAMGYTNAHNQVISLSATSSSPQSTWLGATGSAGSWTWNYPPFNSPQLFSNGNSCVYSNVCAWGSGQPSTGSCLVVNNFVWSSVSCTSTQLFTCEVPYSTTYKCFNGRVSVYDARTACEKDGGWLATIPTLLSSTVLLSTASCAAITVDYMLIGASDLNGPNQNFRWDNGPLAQESNGMGRLFSTGLKTTGVTLYGFPTLPWGTVEPNNANGVEHCVCIEYRTDLNDIYCTVTGPSLANQAYACEYNAVTTTAPQLQLCSKTSPVTISSGTTIQNCDGAGVWLVYATLNANQVAFTNARIFIFGNNQPLTVVISSSQFTGTAVALVGTFATGSQVTFLSNTFTLNSRVDVGQAPNVACFFFLSQVVLSSGAQVAFSGNLITYTGADTVSVVTDDGAMTSSGSFTLASNIITVTTSGSSASLFQSLNSGPVLNSGNMTFVRNTVTLKAATQATYILYSGSQMTQSKVIFFGETVSLTAPTATLANVGTLTLTRASWEWDYSTVTFASTTQSTVLSLTATVDANSYIGVITDTFAGAVSASAIISGSLSGGGQLQLQCVTFFTKLLLEVTDYQGLVPSFTNIVVSPCTSLPPTPSPIATTFFTRPPGGFTNTDSGLPQSTLIAIIAGSVGGAVLLIIIIVVICVVVRRQKGKVGQSSKGKSHHGSRSSRSGGGRSSRSGGSRSGGSRSSRSSRSKGASSGVSGSGYTGDTSGVSGSGYTGDGSSYASGSGYTGDTSGVSGSGYTGDGSSYASGSGYTGDTSGVSGSGYTGDGSSYASGSGYTGDTSGVSGSGYTGDGSSYASGSGYTGDGSSYASGSGYTGDTSGVSGSGYTGDGSSYASGSAYTGDATSGRSSSSKHSSRSHKSRSSKRK